MAIDIDDLLDWEGFGDDAEALLRKYYPQLLELAYSDAGELLGDDGIRWDLSNPRVKDVIDTLATKIRDIAQTTREDIRRWVEVGTEEGQSVQEIARQIRSNANNIAPSRALTIARTESAHAYSAGAVLAYKDAGVQEKEWLATGDADDDLCGGMNGEIVGIDEDFSNGMSYPPAHPNCRCAVAPVVR